MMGTMKSLCWLLFIFILGCASKSALQYDKVDSLRKIEEYEKSIEVKPAVEAPNAATTTTAVSAQTPPQEKKTGKSKKNKKDKEKPKKVVEEPESKVHLPDIEDSEGFVGRRPIVDPFRVGEKIVLNLSYFNIVAGTLTLETKPFVEVNGEKAYHFEVHALSNSFFSRIYSVDDRATTYVSYKNLTPFNLAITLTESKQLAETRTLFDWKTLKAHYWKKKVTKEHGEEQEKLDWDIKAFSQNVISAAYYLRTFKMEVGKKLALRVVDEGKNIIFTGEVIKREEIETDAGKFKTVVIRPRLEVDGAFAQVGEMLMWLTDDDRKLLVRAETKIRIGSLVAKAKEIVLGGDSVPAAAGAKDPAK